MKVLFDLDGVLLDSESDLSWLKRALSKTLKEFDIKDTEENRCKLYPKKVKNFKEKCKDFNVNPENLWRARNENYIKENINAMEDGVIKPFPEVKSLYNLNKHELGIISNSPQRVLDKFIEQFDYNDLFKAWVGRGSNLEDLKYIKPNTYLFEMIKQEIGKGEFIYIGDTENDRRFAKNIGIEFLHLTRSNSGYKSLNEIIDYLEENK